MKLNKYQIAERQLEVAAKIYLADGDFLAIITLAGAAEEILGNLLERNGKPNVKQSLFNIDKEITGGRRPTIVNSEINGIRNALKHAKDPSEDELDIGHEAAISMLARALANYSLAGLKLSDIMTQAHDKIKQARGEIYNAA